MTRLDEKEKIRVVEWAVARVLRRSDPASDNVFVGDTCGDEKSFLNIDAAESGI